MASVELLQAVAVTAELCGLTLSEAAAGVFVGDLAVYDEAQVIAALRRCRREVRGRLTVHDVVSRIDDGRPGPDEAWGLIPVGEEASTVWTEEIAQAWSVACHAEAGFARRASFRESYASAVAMARDAGIKPKWTVSLGWSEKGRESAVLLALEKGRISPQYAAQFAALPPPSVDVLAISSDLAEQFKRLTAVKQTEEAGQ